MPVFLLMLTLLRFGNEIVRLSQHLLCGVPIGVASSLVLTCDMLVDHYLHSGMAKSSPSSTICDVLTSDKISRYQLPVCRQLRVQDMR